MALISPGLLLLPPDTQIYGKQANVCRPLHFSQGDNDEKAQESGNPRRTADKQITCCNAPLSPVNDDTAMNNAT